MTLAAHAASGSERRECKLTRPLAVGSASLPKRLPASASASARCISILTLLQEFEFLHDRTNSSGSVASLTEDDLLEAQGEMVR